MPCWRRDRGFHNYGGLDAFSANKPTMDTFFLHDLQRRCDSYAFYRQPVAVG